jgi:hypothetical protein
MSLRGRTRDQAAEDTQTVTRVAGALKAYLAEAGPDAAVSIRHVLDLLNPRGMWSYDPERRKTAGTGAERQRTDPDADPLTGARWAGAPGTEPPEN